MIIMETITEQDREDFYGSPVGIFNTLADDTDPWHEDMVNMSAEYYLFHSGDKTISPFFSRTIEYYPNNLSRANSVVGSLIRSKFRQKWVRLYNALGLDYDILLDKDNRISKEGTITNDKNFENITERDADDGETVTYNSNDNKTADNSRTTTYNSSVTDSFEKTEDYDYEVTLNNDNNVWGFNTTSTTGVRQNAFGETSVEKHRIAEGDYTETNTKTNSGEDTVADTVNESTQKRGTDETITHYSGTFTKSGEDNTIQTFDTVDTEQGRNKSGASLIEEEIVFRNKRIFCDIMAADIDSIIALSIYV